MPSEERVESTLSAPTSLHSYCAVARARVRSRERMIETRGRLPDSEVAASAPASRLSRIDRGGADAKGRYHRERRTQA